MSRTATTRLIGALLASALLSSGCQALVLTGEAVPTYSSAQAHDAAAVTHYVALGDSYTAAPLSPLRREIDSCLRSNGNYPAIVAASLDVTITDVSCSGAVTGNMFTSQVFATRTRPPQFQALQPGTDLVTVGIGANDFQFFSRMMVLCLSLADEDPKGAPCMEHNRTPKGRDRLARNLHTIDQRVTEVVRGIQSHAPHARVLTVGYPQLLPEEGACRGRLPLALGDYHYTRHLFYQLSKAVQEGTMRAGAEYVDVSAASKGHDICSTKPWVAGVHGEPRRAMGLHPYPTEQRAVARLILKIVS